MNISKRKYTFWSSFPGISSERAKIILSNNKDGAELAKAIRKSRREGNSIVAFEIQQETAEQINQAEAH